MIESAILDCTCKYFNVSKEDVLNKNISRGRIVYPRKIVAYLLAERKMPKTLIGVFLHVGERTKVIYYIKKIQDLVDIGDQKVLRDMQTIREVAGGVMERKVLHLGGQRVEILYQTVEKKINIKDISCKNVVSLLENLNDTSVFNKLSNLIK